MSDGDGGSCRADSQQRVEESKVRVEEEEVMAPSGLVGVPHGSDQVRIYLTF